MTIRPKFHYRTPILVLAGLLFLALACGDGGFAPPATVPPGLAAAAPQEWEPAAPGGPEDTFQAALLAALRTPGHDDPTVTAALPALTQLHQQQPALLLRYLAISPAWRISGRAITSSPPAAGGSGHTGGTSCTGITPISLLIRGARRTSRRSSRGSR